MSIIVNDSGFVPDTWDQGFCPFGEAANDVVALDIPSDTDPADIAVTPCIKMIRVDFPSFADGRGFTIARMLRLAGYTGQLRARGHIIADQYAMARRAGFDEVEITQDMAARQPQTQWQFRADWKSNDYQNRMRG